MQQTTPSNPGIGSEQPSVQKIAENPNPRANENIKQTSFEEKKETDDPSEDVGTEITDGEAG